MNASQRIVLGALAKFANHDGQAKRSQRKLSEDVHRSPAVVNRALAGLEKAGLIVATKTAQGRGTSTYTLTEKGAQLQQKEDPPFSIYSGLLDCFRASDLVNAGHPWQDAPKGVPMPLKQVRAYAKTQSAGGTRACLQRLSALAVPAVTSHPDPSDRRHTLYTFQPLTESDQALILEDLNSRTGRWRPRTRAETEAKHAIEREAFQRDSFTAQELAELLINDIVPDEHGCWHYQGRITTEGYVLIPGSFVTRGHRIVYAAHVEPIPPYAQIHHACNMPMCLNPGHLVALSPEQHRWYTSNHGQASAQALQYVTECKEHGTRLAHGNPALPPSKFPCAEHEAELGRVSYIVRD